MVAKTRPCWRELPWLLGMMLAACAPLPATKTAGVPPRPSEAAPASSRAALSAAPPDSPAPVAPSASAPRLQLAVAPMPEQTGGEFGIAVPMLRVTLRNSGLTPESVPKPGVDLIASLRVVISTPTTVEFRRVKLYKAWEVSLQPLAPATEIHQVLSPLSREQRDVPLAPGRYQVGVCVIPPKEALYPSAFLEQFGGTCSNEIELTVRRRK